MHPRTVHTQRAAKAAGQRARQFFHEVIQPIHVLLGLFEAGGNANSILRHLGHDPQQLYSLVVSICREMPFQYYITMGPLPQTRQTANLFAESQRRVGAPAVTTSDVLMALASTSGNSAAEFMQSHGLTLAVISDHIWVVKDAFRVETDEQICELGGTAVCSIEADTIADHRERGFRDAFSIGDGR